MLSQKYSAALASTRSTAANPHLLLLSKAVEQVEQSLKSNPSLQYFVDTLLDLLEKPNFALTPKITNEFAQILGEAHFWTMCKEHGLVLNRIPEQRHKTPDFETTCPSPKIHFEVKTLSIVDGEYGVADTLTSGVDTNIHLEEQLGQGKRIAIAEHEVHIRIDPATDSHDHPATRSHSKVAGNMHFKVATHSHLKTAIPILTAIHKCSQNCNTAIL